MSKKNKAPLPEPESLALPRTGVESHAHLDLEPFAADLAEVLDRARRSGVRGMGNVFLGPDAYHAGKALFAAAPDVFFLLGIHPGDADKCDAQAVAAMRQAFADDPRLRAVGEIGLDYYWDDHPRDLQQQVFRMQLALAREVERPVVIHSRDANADVLAILEEEGFRNYPLLWHCFGADAATAERIVANGWHVSIPGPVSYPKNDGLREALRVIPQDRMLLETDCPYLTPMPYRGKRNEPAFLVFTARVVAETLGVPVADLWTQCGRNAARFFGLADWSTEPSGSVGAVGSGGPGA